MNLGQYLGDIWVFDFKELKYTDVKINPKIEGDLSKMTVDQIKDSKGHVLQLMKRSNHTSVYYKPHNS